MTRLIMRASRLSTGLLVALSIPRTVWAAPVALPWDRPLEAIADYLTGPAIYTLAKIVLLVAALGYGITGKNGEGIRHLLRVGIGLAIALNAVRIMNFLFS
jgi:type IV secretory pathway VirB2 component (pilin)